MILLGWFEWIPMGLFPFIPWIVAFVAASGFLLLSLRSLGKAYAASTRTVLATLTCGVAAFAVMSGLIAGYIFFQPLRDVEENRWLAGVERVDIPEMGEVEPLDNVLGEVVNPWVEAFNRGAEQANQGSQLSEQVGNTFQGFMHISEVAAPYVMQAIVAAFVLVVLGAILWLMARRRNRALEHKLKKQDDRIAELERRVGVSLKQPAPRRR